MDGNGEFNSDDHYIYYCGQELLRRNGVALIVIKRSWNAVLGCNLKNRLNSVYFQGIPFNTTAIYVPNTNAKEDEVEWFCEELQVFLELTAVKDVFFFFHHKGMEWKSRKSRDSWNDKHVWSCSTKWSRANTNREFCQENTLVIAMLSSSNTRNHSTNGHRWNFRQCPNRIDYILSA